MVIHLLLSCVQAQCFDQPWRVDVFSVAVLQECKQILKMLTDGLRLIICNIDKFVREDEMWKKDQPTEQFQYEFAVLH